MASQKDIAQALNVSVPLVSRVLSGRMGTTGCSETMKEAIRAKAKELGYKVNPIGRALRTGRTGSLGVFIHPYGAPGSILTRQMLTGLSTEANNHAQRLWLSFYETDKEFLHRFTKTARAEIDGLLVAGIFHPRLTKLYKAIEDNGIPVVTMLKQDEDTPAGTNVHCDDRLVGYLPTQHLLEKGRRRIAHIHSIDARHNGYVQALQEAGLQEDPALVYPAEHQFEVSTGANAVRHWIENGIEFDGLVAQSDYQAFGAIRELREKGRRVPEDVMVTGVDNSPSCELSAVPITSVSQRMDDIGKLAVQIMMKRIESEEAQSVTIEPTLCLRASTAD